MITEVKCGVCGWEFTVLDHGTVNTVKCPTCKEPVEVRNRHSPFESNYSRKTTGNAKQTDDVAVDYAS